jgi:hypothetical protein
MTSGYAFKVSHEWRGRAVAVRRDCGGPYGFGGIRHRVDVHMIWLRLLPYFLAATLVGGGVWYVMDLRATVAAQGVALDGYELRLGGCEARAANLINERESDDAIERLTDDDLRNPNSDWLRQAD